MPTHPSTPSVSHLVLNVRDIEASHRFYTEMLGFEPLVPKLEAFGWFTQRIDGNDHRPARYRPKTAARSRDPKYTSRE